MAEEEKNEREEAPETSDSKPEVAAVPENDAADRTPAPEEKSSGAESRNRQEPRRQESRGSSRSGSDSRRSGGSDRGRGRRGYFRKKVCRLCVNKIDSLDYKDVESLKRFVTDRGKILPRRMTGTCAKHQRVVSAAVKRARMVALLPYVEK
jgi:small subunit ribosomal protein S18